MRIRRPLVALGVLSLLLSGLVQAAPVSAAQQCFAETGHCIQGRFLDYWEANGGLARNGYPLTAERRELLEDGKEYTVQYFERVRLELHPENAAPNDVLLGQFGRRILREDYTTVAGTTYEQATAPVAGSGPYYFAQTGHTIAPRFQAYWQQNGGLAQFGYPITEERYDGLADSCCITQYFERARFEWHPENEGTPYVILLGQFGRRLLADEALLTGEFGDLYRAIEPVRAALGRPVGPTTTTPGALQPFERGRMFWAKEGPYTYYSEGGSTRTTIFVLCGNPAQGDVLSTSYYSFAPDFWAEGQEPGGGPAPIPGRYLPKRGFGKLWRENEFVSKCLGYASTPNEVGFTMSMQQFQGGMLFLSDTPEDHAIYSLKVRRNCNSCGNTITYQRYPLSIR
ncbi:MAG TPA: hypothetical protein VIL85_18755 [Thermomicrobiales bacterium]|jgi:hypothetical protein